MPQPPLGLAIHYTHLVFDKEYPVYIMSCARSLCFTETLQVYITTPWLSIYQLDFCTLFNVRWNDTMMRYKVNEVDRLSQNAATSLDYVAVYVPI